MSGKLTDEDYAEMAKDYAENPIRADEIIGPVEHWPNGKPPISSSGGYGTEGDLR